MKYLVDNYKAIEEEFPETVTQMTITGDLLFELLAALIPRGIKLFYFHM
jgi:hypothetical protein